MNANSDSRNELYSYVGNELENAALAVHWKAYFRSRIGQHVRGNVLEVGAGLGGTTLALRDGAQTSWLCLEPDARLAAQLRTRLATQSSPVATSVVVGDLRTLEPARLFDCILYIDVLEHIEHDVAELANAANRLAPGGRLVVLCPAVPALFSELDVALGHFRRYTKRTLRAAFPSSLNTLDAFYLDSVGMLASLTNKLLLRQRAPTVRQVKAWDGMIIPVSRVVDAVIGRSIGRSIVVVAERPT